MAFLIWETDQSIYYHFDWEHDRKSWQRIIVLIPEDLGRVFACAGIVNLHHNTGVGKCPILGILFPSPSNICWRLYPQQLGDVQLGHLPTPDGGLLWFIQLLLGGNINYW